MVQKRVYPLLLTVVWLASLVLGQQVNVVPSKYILTSDDQSVILQCFSYGLQANPYNVVVFTIMDKVIYNSSNSNQLASGVEVINSTAINYSNIGNGVIDVGCKINNTASMAPTTIPFIAPVTFSHNPSGFNYNTSYFATCGYSITPNVSNTVVSFTVNQTTIAQYSNFPFQPPLFSMPTQVPGLTVLQGNQSSSIFLQVTNSTGSGNFQCSLTITVSSGSVTVNSTVWNTNNSFTLAPSILLVALFIVIGSHFSLK